MKYLNTKPGSIEEVAASMSKYAAESEYQQMFKKELEKAGKGIGSMTPAEKKAFFNKIDSKYTAKNEQAKNPYAIGMAAAMKAKDDQPPLKKSTITKAHDIAKSIMKKEQADKVCPKCGKVHIQSSNCGGMRETKSFSQLRTETKVIKLGDKGKTATGKDAAAVDVEPSTKPI